MKKNLKINRQSAQGSAMTDDFKICNENFDKLCLEINAKFKQIAESFELASSGTAPEALIVSKCEAVFGLKAEMYHEYQQALEIYGKMLETVGGDEGDSSISAIMEEKEEYLKLIKSQFDVVRKQTRALSQIYEKLTAK